MSNDLNTRIANLVRPEIQELHSYHVPDSSGLLKMDAMENPNAWPGKLMDEWKDRLTSIEVNRYPDPSASGVKAGLRQLLDLDAIESKYDTSLDILLGNGSDEIIQIIAMCLASKERCIMAPEPSFVMYGMIAKFVGMAYHGVELGEDFEIDVDIFLQQIEAHNPALIFLALPNNPTGNIFKLSDVEQIIRATNGLVVLDEAYMAFTDSDLLELAAEHDNVVVMRTLSKVGLAGLRLGFLIGQTPWLTQFDKVRLPYNINVLTQMSAEFALEHYADLKAQTAKLRSERESLFTQLQALDGVSPYESHANFILVRLLDKNARDIFEAMKQSGVLIKCLDGAHPKLANCLRLTVGLEQENRQMLDALSSALKQA